MDALVDHSPCIGSFIQLVLFDYGQVKRYCDGVICDRLIYLEWFIGAAGRTKRVVGLELTLGWWDAQLY